MEELTTCATCGKRLLCINGYWMHEDHPDTSHPPTPAADYQRKRIAILEAQIRRLVVVASNRALNAAGGVGTGDAASDAMRRALMDTLSAPLPAWAARDDVVMLPAMPTWANK